MAENSRRTIKRKTWVELLYELYVDAITLNTSIII